MQKKRNCTFFPFKKGTYFVRYFDVDSVGFLSPKVFRKCGSFATAWLGGRFCAVPGLRANPPSPELPWGQQPHPHACVHPGHCLFPQVTPWDRCVHSVSCALVIIPCPAQVAFECRVLVPGVSSPRGDRILSAPAPGRARGDGPGHKNEHMKDAYT